MSARRLHQSEPKPRPVSTLAGALWDEFEIIHQRPRVAATAQGPDASLHAYYKAALESEQAALCLSGGGIRSATFSLGVLQGLARSRMLTKFHYLSTVSGGGYIGGWLAMLLRERKGDAGKVQDLLAGRVAPPELDALRRYTNFLAPRPGLTSPDIWAGVVLWVRNVLVNWLIFLPALFALALLPGLYADVLAATGPGWSWLLLGVALLCLGIGFYNGAMHLPSHKFPEPLPPGRIAGVVVYGIVLPLTLWSVLVPLVAAPWLRQVMPEGAILGDAIPPLSFIVMELAYVAAALRASDEDRKQRWHNFGWWTSASAVAAGVLWLALTFAIGRSPSVIATLGPLAVTLAHLVQSVIYIAFRVEAFRGDLDREWLARLDGEKVLPALIWAVFAAICLFLPQWVLDGWNTKSLVTSAAGLLTGPLAAYLGKVSKDVPSSNQGTGGRTFVPPTFVLIDLIAAAFGITLFMLLARLGATLTSHNWVAEAVLVATTALFAWLFGRRINVNRFSMHAVYRARLMPAFLGSARPERTPDGFTGIDPHDNPRMDDLRPTGDSSGKAALFPVVNVTLNMVEARNTAWTERKGENFTITPCNCGGGYLHRKEDIAAGVPVRGAYVRTAEYAGSEKETGPKDSGNGITLGTAITLSGAAASPSMGYHSSPATAFLMTLFNVRLGAWLPNPATASAAELRAAKPPNALLTLTRELLGLTDDQGKAVYLTDGGHFENLGIYEMIRRRCRYILVVDAGEDPTAVFEDLGNAVRKARIDLDIEIEFDPPVGIGSRNKPVKPFRSFACATIRYPENDKVCGRLIYIKPCDPPYMTMDVRAYYNGHPVFPHDPTLEQFFTESEFESYRQLGLTEITRLASDSASLDQFFDRAQQQVKVDESQIGNSEV